MQEMLWLDEHHIPGGTLDGSIDLANQLYWNLTVVEHDQHWFVLGGEKVILKTSSREALEAFLYGLGLAYGVLPDHIFHLLRDALKHIVE